MVVDRARTQDVKNLVEALKNAGRSEQARIPRCIGPGALIVVLTEVRVFRSSGLWCNQAGSCPYRCTITGPSIDVSGAARVTCGDRVYLRENQSTYIPAGEKHAWKTQTPNRFISLRCSRSYLGEDDIVRFEDGYGRVAADPASED